MTPSGYLAFVFIFFVLAVSLFACAQIGASQSTRRPSSGSRPCYRFRSAARGWLGGRLLLAACAAVAISVAAGLFSWAGAESAGVTVSLPRMLEAGANCLPVALLFLGIAALAYALVPRASAGIAYGLVAVAFLWDLFGSLLGAPKWLVELTPFAHVGLVPAQPLRATAALIMLALAALVSRSAIWAFRRRDLAGV